ncbi:MAG: molybdopterin-binding protein, partial [Planctomycetota bacterium]
MLRAAILSIGDELILGDKGDANAPWLTRRLAAEGVQTMEQRTVPDDRALIAQAVRELAGRFDVLLITGGLGPTPDDLTRDALGDVLTP